jgi:hypothetical protein
MAIDMFSQEETERVLALVVPIQAEPSDRRRPVLAACELITLRHSLVAGATFDEHVAALRILWNAVAAAERENAS